MIKTKWLRCLVLISTCHERGVFLLTNLRLLETWQIKRWLAIFSSTICNQLFFLTDPVLRLRQQHFQDSIHEFDSGWPGLGENEGIPPWPGKIAFSLDDVELLKRLRQQFSSLSISLGQITMRRFWKRTSIFTRPRCYRIPRSTGKGQQVCRAPSRKSRGRCAPFLSKEGFPRAALFLRAHSGSCPGQKEGQADSHKDDLQQKEYARS